MSKNITIPVNKIFGGIMILGGTCAGIVMDSLVKDGNTKSVPKVIRTIGRNALVLEANMPLIEAGFKMMEKENGNPEIDLEAIADKKMKKKLDHELHKASMYFVGCSTKAEIIEALQKTGDQVLIGQVAGYGWQLREELEHLDKHVKRIAEIVGVSYDPLMREYSDDDIQGSTDAFDDFCKGRLQVLDIIIKGNEVVDRQESDMDSFDFFVRDIQKKLRPEAVNEPKKEDADSMDIPAAPDQNNNEEETK